MIADVLALAVAYVQHAASTAPNPNDVQVPSVDADIAGQVRMWVGIVGAALGGGGLTVGIGGPIIAARVKKVRQYSDVRDDATVENEGLKAAAAEWRSIATDARDQAKGALADLRTVLTDKDKQIADQRLIIDDLRGIIRLRDETIADLKAGRAVETNRNTELADRLVAAEARERELIRTRDEIAARLADSERKIAETTLDPSRIRELREMETGGNRTHPHDRHGLRSVD